MLDAVKAVGWRNRFILPALRQAALRNQNVAVMPDMMIVVELWLWAVFFRFSGEYGALNPTKQAKLREEAFKASFHDYKNAHKAGLFDLARELSPQYGGGAMNVAILSLQTHIRPTFEHAVIAAQKLAPLHEHFDLAAVRKVLSQVNVQFLEVPGHGSDTVERDRQYNLKLVAQVVAVGQAQLYAMLTGLLIPADIVLIDDHAIPDLIDVFISYARDDADFVSDLARRMEMSGVNAWLDRGIPADAQFDRVISDQISAAKLVLAVWSPRSVSSKWVRAESLAGFNADKLMQLRLSGCEIPTPFNIVQTTEVGAAGMTPEAYAPFIDTVRQRIGAL